MKRRVFGLCLALLLALCSAAVADVMYNLQNADISSCEYIVLEDGTVALTGLTLRSNDTVASYTFPETISDGKKTYRVSALDDSFDGIIFADTLVIPDSVTVSANVFGRTLAREIRVSDTHPTLTTVDGVLFDQSMNTLLCYPRKKEGELYRIPEGVTAVAHRAFYDNQMVRNIGIPDTVRTLYGNPFAGCMRLGKLVLSDAHPTLAFLQDALFDKTDARLITCLSTNTQYTVMDGVTAIEDYAFANITYRVRMVQEIRLPATVQRIGDYAFANCDQLTAINLPYRLRSIGRSAFYGCDALEQLDLPAGLHQLGEYAFEQSGLTTLSLPATLNVVPEYLAYRCGQLTTVHLPDGLTEIGRDAFYGCAQLSQINFPASLKKIGSYALKETALQTVQFPAGLEELGDAVFAECRQLTEAIIPAGVTAIANNVFENCDALRAVTLPETLKEIGSFAFRNCRNLGSLYVPASVEKIGSKAFEGCDQLTLQGSVNSAAENWCLNNNFKYELVNAPTPAVQTLPWLSGDTTWTCSNGHAGLTTNYCPHCGEKRPE